MHTIHLNAVTRPDGTVLLNVPTGAPAGEQVDVEVRIAKKAKSFRSKKEWQTWVRQVAGSIEDPAFERPPQPDIDTVEPM